MMHSMLKLNDSSSWLLEEIVERYQLKSTFDLASGGIGVFIIFWIASRNQDSVPDIQQSKRGIDINGKAVSKMLCMLQFQFIDRFGIRMR